MYNNLKTEFLNIKLLTLLAIVFLCCFQNCAPNKKIQRARQNSNSQYYAENDFKSIEKINTHVHLRIYDTTFPKQAINDNFRLLNINVNSPSGGPVEKQKTLAVSLINAYPDYISYATTFSVNNWNSNTWQQETLDYLKESFDMGAIAVKVWKNIGMELRDKNGKFVMIDDPRFDPIIDFIEKSGKTLIGHLGEPRNCWLPIEKMTVKGDKDYFSTHPQYHMYLHPEYPSYEDLIIAKDRMLEKHPNIRFVGAHLGSLEWSVDKLAKRLDKFPNMAVDMAERISHFQYQAVTDWQKVHDFFIKYQDRLIYATDQTIKASNVAAATNREAHESWLRHWRFFTSGEKMKVPKVENEFNGLKLPREVVDKIYRKNAEKWFPEIAKTDSKNKNN